ncbi:hypothetical protein EDD37DRAFT_192462 [Exophiala viscosa]|uniref:uncharacterized protein n=1 Tax=Exophiala viscosa TaxID=2486360 RepID=UPI00219F9E90|nr:hypothetical protein EDD37DRAFT_192462 [Exophiala viscosa]
MPPVRTTPPTRPIKTERTHEENQERAYIAASRRSDRSLEARVESARRASEIHKRRTGRSLRVTEQDVINEEMYEEEDDDLPMQYRRLTAHLQTGSTDFNRRLAAYLTNQVAMRSAMEQMVQNSYGQYPNGPYPQNQNMFPSPMLPPQNVAQSPQQSYRPAPYQSPHQPGYRSNHGRAYSMAAVPNNQASASPQTSAPPMLDQRRMSTPASIQPGDTKPDPEYIRQTQSATNGSFPPLWQDMGPFTTSLPPESQQMLAHAPGFDSNNPSYAMLMQGSDQLLSNPYYPWNDIQGGIKGMPVHPSAYPGMSATLAPAALEHAADNKTETTTTGSTPAASHSNQPPTPAAEYINPPTMGLDFNFSQESKGFGFSVPALGSGQVTPAGEGFWDHFVMDGSWEDGTSPAAVTPTTGRQ